MRWLATAGRIRTFLSRLGAAAQVPTTAYLTGGSTAVLLGWRESTIDTTSSWSRTPVLGEASST